MVITTIDIRLELKNRLKIFSISINDFLYFQADVSHAYQIIHKNGIPKERIIVMMYDDIAFNRL